MSADGMPSVATYLAMAHRALRLAAIAPDIDDFNPYDALRDCDAIADRLADFRGRLSLACHEAAAIGIACGYRGRP